MVRAQKSREVSPASSIDLSESQTQFIPGENDEDEKIDSEDDEEAHEVINRTFEALGRMD